MDNLPIYNMTFDPESFESGINLIALTENPAIEVDSMRFSAEQLEKLIFTDKDKRIVAGPAIIPDKKIYRNFDGKEFYVVFTKEVIELMVEKFNSENRDYKFNLEHNEDELVAGFIKGSWIIEDTEHDKSKFYGFEDLPVGTWFIEAKVEDENIWETHIKEMSTVGFSIEGLLGIVTPGEEEFTKINKIDNMEDKKIDETLNVNEEVKETIEDTVEVVEETVEVELAEEEVEEKVEEAPKEVEEEVEVEEENPQEDLPLEEILAKIVDLQARIEELEAKANEEVEEEMEAEKFSKNASISDRIFNLRNITK